MKVYIALPKVASLVQKFQGGLNEEKISNVLCRFVEGKEHTIHTYIQTDISPSYIYK